MARTAANDFEIPRTGEGLWDKVKRAMAEANGSASKNMGIVVICLCALIPGCLALLGGGIAWGENRADVRNIQQQFTDYKAEIDRRMSKDDEQFSYIRTQYEVIGKQLAELKGSLDGGRRK